MWIFFKLLVLIIMNLVIGCSDKVEDAAYNDLLTFVENDNINVGYKYNETDDLWISFLPKGANSIIGIASMSTTPTETTIADDITNNSDRTELFRSCTDWIGPYIVRKGFNKPDCEPQFTGGWHGNNIDGTGEPSAQMIDYSVHIDEYHVNHNVNKLSNKVSIKVKNNIQGYNTLVTKQEILEETVAYHITKGNIEVEVTIKALEDIVIERYYGLQTQNTFFDGQLMYQGSNNIFLSSETHKSLPKNTNCKNLVTIKSKDDRHSLNVYLDNTYGLGKGEYVSHSNPYAFTMSYGKTYFNLVNGKELYLKKGETVRWRGKYSFEYDDN